MGGPNFQPTVAVSVDDLRKQWVSTRGGNPADTGAAQPVQPPAPEVDAPGETPAPTK
jgi:hypothetical protein